MTMESQEITTETKDLNAPVGATTENKPSMPIPEHLTQQQALQVLVDAARVAQSKGLFSLDDAELVNKAIKAFIPQGPVASNP